MEFSASSLARRVRSERLLRERGIALNPLLPLLPDEKTVRPHLAPAVAERSLALFAVAARAEGLSQLAAVGFLEAGGLWGAATREEQLFLLDPEPAPQERLLFLWRYESLQVLLWALGQLELPELPTRLADRSQVSRLLWNPPPYALFGNALLRPAEELLDLADLTLCCHWIAAEARLRGTPPPAGLDPAIAYERHYAFTWLLRLQDQGWDDISTEL